MKEFLYVGHYYDIDNKYILKIGTTNDLDRRQKEHTRNYRKSSVFRLSECGQFVYDWYVKLSKYNTLRYEDRNRLLWQGCGVGEFIRNDRFFCPLKPDVVQVKIRKVYDVFLS